MHRLRSVVPHGLIDEVRELEGLDTMSAYNMAPVCKQHVLFFVLDNTSLGSRATYLAEESIYCDGDRAEHWYEVISGGVRACKLLPDGRRQVVEFYLPGDQFGFDDLDGFHTLSAESVAVQRTVAVVHFRTKGEMAPTPSCYAMTGWRRTESGRPAISIRFSTATPMAASVCWAAKPRARRRGPISVL